VRLNAQVLLGFKVRCCQRCKDINVISGQELTEDLKIKPVLLAGLPSMVVRSITRHGPLSFVRRFAGMHEHGSHASELLRAHMSP
jgi:hypothetical protein